MQDGVNPLRPEGQDDTGARAATSSDRTHVEVPLPFSEFALRSVLANVPAIIAQFDLEGNLTFLNRAVPGMTSDEVLGRHISELVPPPFRTELMSRIAKVIESRESETFEFPGIGPQGSTAIYSGRAAPVIDHGRLVGLTSVVTDVTDRRRAESRARLYADIVEHIRLGLFVLKLERGEAGSTLRCVSSNPASEHFSGIAAEEFTGRTIDEVFPALRKSGFVDLAEQVIATGKPIEIDGFPVGDRQRAAGDWAVSAFPLPDDHLGIAIQDVAGRRKTERQSRRLLDELAHLGRISTMGEMASGLAHELNQPLAAIVAYVDACQELVDSGKMNSEQLAEVLRAVSEQAERAGQIIHRLRRMIKRSQPVRSLMSVNDAVREVAVLLAAEARHAGVAVQLELTEDRLETAADFLQIQQVVLNLMRNGLEAMTDVAADQRQLTIATRRMPAGEVEIAVADMGRGLTADSAERAFEPFFTIKANGLGLGLSISRTIVEAHGGRIWITPNPTQGVTARFTLPSRGQKADHDSQANRVHR